MAVAKKRRKKRRGSSGGGGGWRRSPITAVISIVIILLCLYNLFLSDSSSGASRFKGDYVCRSCKEVSRLPFIRGDAPHECPSCNAKELYSALKCNDCSKVTASLPPIRNFTCSSCGHFEDVRLDPLKGPHPCPKCKAKTFSETYECLSCKHVFPYQFNPNSATNPSDDPDAMYYMEGENIAECPKCKKQQGYPFTQNPMVTCEHCDSENLSSITPISVVKWELGRDLKRGEQKEVDEWLEKNPQ